MNVFRTERPSDGRSRRWEAAGPAREEEKAEAEAAEAETPQRRRERAERTNERTKRDVTYRRAF